MLYKFHNDIIIVGLLTMLFAAFFVGGRAYCLMTLVTVLSFLTQMCLLLYFSRSEDKNFSSKTLFLTTYMYSVVLGTIYMMVSYYYEGDTFMFSKSDAIFYYENSMRAADKGFIPNAKYFMDREPYDDWGALFFDSFLMYILPSKLFLNAIYMLTGAISSVMLFRISRHIMPDVYALCGALAYSTSSYLIFFHCTFLKESVFVFFVICAMYYFYKAIMENSFMSYLYVILLIGVLVFFRPAVAAMIVAAIFAYYAIAKNGHAISLFLYLGVVIIFAGATKFMIESFDHYSGGSMDKMIDYGAQQNSYSGGFNYFVSLFGAIFGPFPTLFPKTEGTPITINFYGAGLTIRQFLMIPFWIGAYYAIKQKNIYLIPVLVFNLFELLATGIMMASLELRKVMPHIPLMYIFSSYGLYQWHKNRLSERWLRICINSLSIGILMLWVVFR